MPVVFFYRIWKANTKMYIEKCKEESNFLEKEQSRFTLPGFKIYWHKGRMQIKRRD